MAALSRRCRGTTGYCPRSQRRRARWRQRQKIESATQRLSRRRQCQCISWRISLMAQRKSKMKTTIKPLTQRRAWKALAALRNKTKSLHLRKLFADDPKRGTRLTAQAPGLFLDYSKNRVTDQTLKLLLQLATESGLRERIDAMFSGEKINLTENRAVLHVALRAPKGARILVDGKDIVPEVHAVLDKMERFSKQVRSGAWKGETGKRIKNVVNTAIGGPPLGSVLRSV